MTARDEVTDLHRQAGQVQLGSQLLGLGADLVVAGAHGPFRGEGQEPAAGSLDEQDRVDEAEELRLQRDRETGQGHAGRLLEGAGDPGDHDGAETEDGAEGGAAGLGHDAADRGQELEERLQLLRRRAGSWRHGGRIWAVAVGIAAIATSATRAMARRSLHRCTASPERWIVARVARRGRRRRRRGR